MVVQCESHRHAFGIEAESCAVYGQGEDEVLSGLTVLDRNLWMRIEEMQCVSQRLTCNMSVEPLVILAHYNIPERDISLESIGLFSRPRRCYTSAPTIVSLHLKN